MAGGVDHGADADGGIHKEQLRWFDYSLKGTKDDALLDEAPVRYFEQGSKQWRTANRLPAAGTAEVQRFYLSGLDILFNGMLGAPQQLYFLPEVEKQRHRRRRMYSYTMRVCR